MGGSATLGGALAFNCCFSPCIAQSLFTTLFYYDYFYFLRLVSRWPVSGFDRPLGFLNQPGNLWCLTLSFVFVFSLNTNLSLAIEMSPPIYFHWVRSIQSISKNKNSFGNFEKFSKQLWNSRLSIFYRLEMTEVRVQRVIFRCGKRGHIIDFLKLHVVFFCFPFLK